MAKRIPAIIAGAGEGFGEDVVKRLAALSRAIAADGAMVLDYANWPVEGWEDLPRRVNGKQPSQVPFFDFEFWMYFRILEAVRFPETGADPFRATKHRDLDRHLNWATEAVLKTHSFADALKLSLDANAHDLSQIDKPLATYQAGRDRLEFPADGLRRLNIIADNFGGEFVADLILAVIAAEAGIETVVHVKSLPMFVSDTTLEDVTILIDRLPSGSEFGRRLMAAVRVEMIRFAAHPFWAAPLFLDRLPVAELGAGDKTLNVLKGDLNFRRAIGDAVVPVETPFEQMAVLPPAPMLSLRSIKSYCVAGMTDWPTGLSRTAFPMDGSIVAAQTIPARGSEAPQPIVSAESSSDAARPLRRARQWLRRSR